MAKTTPSAAFRDVRLSCEPEPFALAGKPTIDALGIPHQRFVKRIMRAGSFYKASEDLPIEVSHEMLSNWERQFRRMKANGVAVTIPNQHKNAANARETFGYVEDMWVAGDALYMQCELIGDDAILAASRNDVSIFSPVRFVDGEGRDYDRPILHVAICPNPVIPGLGEFVAIAASQSSSGTNERTAAMDMEMLKRFAILLGIEDALSEDNAEQLISAGINRLKEGRPYPCSTEEQTMPSTPAPVAPPPAPAQVPAPAPVTIAASHAEPNAMLVKTLAENRTIKLDGLVKDAVIDKATHTKLLERFVGKDNAAISLSLSRNEDGSDFDFVIDTLRSNKPVKPGERTGAQIVASLDDPLKSNSEQKPAIIADAERRANAAK